MTIEIHLEPELEAELEKLSRESGHPKSYYAETALREYLEDRSDYERAMAVLDRNEPTITLEELGQKLGLNDDD